MEDKLYLTPEDILEHEFKIDARGYRMQEVDKYLDMVIRDYTEFLREINSLKHEIAVLTEDKRKLISEYRKLKDNIDASEQGTPSGGNTDLLRRLSNLEKIVYGKE